MLYEGMFTTGKRRAKMTGPYALSYCEWRFATFSNKILHTLDYDALSSCLLELKCSIIHQTGEPSQFRIILQHL